MRVVSPGRRKLGSYGMPIAKPAKLGPEHLPHWWNPSRPGIRGGPLWFVTQLHAIDPDLAVTWNALTERWLIWVRTPRIHSAITQGWQLLFVVEYANHSYAPLDNRTLAKIFTVSARKWGNAVQYFNRVTAEIERDKQRSEVARAHDVGAMAREYYGHTIPSVSGYGPSNGSKCANLS